MKCANETILSYGKEAKSDNLQLKMYDDNTLGKDNDFTATSTSFVKRQKLAMKGKFYFSSILHCDIFHSVKHLMQCLAVILK